MKLNAVLVDGPRRGMVVPVDNPSTVFQVPVPRPNPDFGLHEAALPFEPNFDTVTYHFHWIILFDRRILVGSVRLDRPASPDLFEALASNTAKDLVYL